MHKPTSSKPNKRTAMTTKNASKKAPAKPVKKATKPKNTKAGKTKSPAKPPVEEVTLDQLKEEEKTMSQTNTPTTFVDPVKVDAAAQRASLTEGDNPTPAPAKVGTTREERDAIRIAKQAEREAARQKKADERKAKQEAARLEKQADREKTREQRATERAAAQERVREARNEQKKADQAKRAEARSVAAAERKEQAEANKKAAAANRKLEAERRRELLQSRKAALKSEEGKRRPRSTYFRLNASGFTQPQKFSVRGELLTFIQANFEVGSIVNIDLLATTPGVQLRGCDIRSLLNKLNESGFIDFITPASGDTVSSVHFADHGNVDGSETNT